MADKQIKTRKRVVDHGEVFTNEREVNAMLDLVSFETQNLDSTFLEPACGDGNFLIEVLRRKMEIVKSRYKRSEEDFYKNTVIVVSSLYGVDIMEDNVEQCRERLFSFVEAFHKSVFKHKMDLDVEKTLKFILSHNILCGDALTLLKNDGTPIIFSEWKLITGDQIKRRDFRLDQILEGHEEQLSIFMDGWEYDEETKAMIPTPIKEFDCVDYRRLYLYE